MRPWPRRGCRLMLIPRVFILELGMVKGDKGKGEAACLG